MKHEESILQQQCVSWFRAQYPQYAMLLVHPINEGSGHTRTDRMRQGIHKAEGAVAGVPDLLFFIPSIFTDGEMKGLVCHGLGIEFKTAKGRQSQEQKDFQKMFETADYMYVVVKGLDEFRHIMNCYIEMATQWMRRKVAAAHVEIVKAAEEREKERFYKIIGKK